MAKRKRLLPNVVYKRIINTNSDLKPTLQVKDGVINIYNKTLGSLSEKPPVDKTEMILDEISPLQASTNKVGGLSDFLLYEVVSGSPDVVAINLIE